MKIVETGNAKFIENCEISRSVKPCDMEIQEVRAQVLLPITSSQVIVPIVVGHFDNLQEQQMNDQTLYHVVS